MKALLNNPGIFLILLFLFSCREEVKKMDDTPESGTIHISVDESFAPVMAEQVKMYEALYPKARIIVSYKPESECLKDLFYDTATRLVITGRGLTSKEDSLLRDTLRYAPGFNLLAFDAIALIVHPDGKDSLFSKNDLKDLLTGKRHDLKVVFDGLKATSTIRYVRDSLLGTEAFAPTVMAADGSREVIRYVAAHPGTLGLVGISWLGNPEDSARVADLKTVKLAGVLCENCPDKNYLLPVPEHVDNGSYPLIRGLYYIIRENYRGLGTGFVSFLKFEQGQLIFRRAYLRPVMDFGVRNAEIHPL